MNLSNYSTSDLINMRSSLLSQDSYDFAHQEQITEDITRIEFELRVTRKQSI